MIWCETGRTTGLINQPINTAVGFPFLILSIIILRDKKQEKSSELFMEF